QSNQNQIIMERIRCKNLFLKIATIKKIHNSIYVFLEIYPRKGIQHLIMLSIIICIYLFISTL
ncbi:MAG TPA: hypothetical protein PKK99_10430, partial [Bacteroidia bacterium]|nr:hypothetical protein [Bacteroidia bacterium]